MSTLRVNTIQNASGGSVISVPGAAKAWVNFNGTGTVAIRAALNVGSITDNGVGDYTLNFTTAMSDANYTTVGSAQRGSASARGCMFEIEPSVAPTTAAVRVRTLTVDTSPGVMDASGVLVAVFD